MIDKDYKKYFGKVFSKTFNETAKNTPKELKVIRFFPNSDLRCSHEGLRAVAKENGIDPWGLSAGEFLVFANTSQTMMKIYAPGNIIAFLRHPLRHRIDLSLVQYIPRFFNGTEFNYEGAMKKMLTQKLAA